jgi:hypothetical protein
MKGGPLTRSLFSFFSATGWFPKRERDAARLSNAAAKSLPLLG